jgi:hypothetical protein
MSKAKTAVEPPPERGRIGSSFDAFTKETGDYEAVKSTALKRVLAWQIGQEMKAQGVTKTELAARMETSRSSLIGCSILPTTK